MSILISADSTPLSTSGLIWGDNMVAFPPQPYQPFISVEIILPNGRLTEVHSVLKDLNVGGMSHYGIDGSGRVKVDPVVAATHPTQTPPEYIMRHKVDVVVKDEQVEHLISKIGERLRDDPQGGKIFVTDVLTAVDIATNKKGEDAI